MNVILLTWLVNTTKVNFPLGQKVFFEQISKIKRDLTSGKKCDLSSLMMSVLRASLAELLHCWFRLLVVKVPRTELLPPSNASNVKELEWSCRERFEGTLSDSKHGSSMSA